LSINKTINKKDVNKTNVQKVTNYIVIFDLKGAVFVTNFFVSEQEVKL